MKAPHTLLAVVAALACGVAAAQLKLPAKPVTPGTAPSAASVAQAAPAAAPAERTPEVKEKEAAATLAASGWLVLLDRRDWGRAWETSAAMFRGSVPLAAWMDGIPKARDLGDFISRDTEDAVYKPTLEGRPNGDYVTVIYGSKFSKKDDVVEIVTTVREADGKWRVTGYSTR
jgi:hypothetical protein